VKDPDFELSLFASEPQIVTPVGIVVDSRNRVFVVESNTHETKDGYAGHPHDRIKIFEDNDEDGKPDRVAVFADGFRHAMNLAFGPCGSLYMTHRAGVVRFEMNHDEHALAKPLTIVELDSEERYPHNGIGGITFSPDGWLYFGLGENLGRSYTVKGSDGSSHSGGGEGGNIFRCRPDGSQVRLFATGFWNTFALQFDRAGRLFAVDNDPDGRPPSRLLHIIEHGDYGYKFRYGRSGHHPFVAWEGELPGTLPMIAGTAEAPSGILDPAQAKLPARYADDLIVTGWGDNVIENFRLRREGASFKADSAILVQGGKTFWPVGIAAAPNGNVYITDWADSQYPVHGRGRIWRMKTKSSPASAPVSKVKQSNADDERLERLLAANAPADREKLFAALKDLDPFIRSAAIASLSAAGWHDDLLHAIGESDPTIRLGALLALRRGQHRPAADLVGKLLRDADESVRRMALIWVGENGWVGFAPDLDASIEAGPVSAELFKTYLAAVELLAAARTGSGKDKSVWAQGTTGAQLIQRVLQDQSKPANLRALAAVMVAEADLESALPHLLDMAETGENRARLEALRTLGQSDSPKVGELLWSIASNKDAVPEVRAEAVLAHARQPIERLAALTNLLHDSAAPVAIETARTLRLISGFDEKTRGILEHTYHRVKNDPQESALAEHLELALFGPNRDGVNPRPKSVEEWTIKAAAGGDPGNGRRVFFHITSACASCHQFEGRGNAIGPDLTSIGRSSDRAKLVQSIIDPSRDIAPQFVSYTIETLDGEIYTGLLHGRGSDGALTLLMATGAKLTLPGDQIASSNASSVSLMPAGLENTLTVQDFRDLVAFLESAK
jgi:putative membrane-bound dehydrogenase-like protein